MKFRQFKIPDVPMLRRRESPVPEYVDTYLKMNPATGFLTFEVYEVSPIRGRIPIPGAKVTVSKLLGDDYYLSKVMTSDSNGETESLPLRTVAKDRSLKPGEGRAYTNYYASIEASGYQKKFMYNIQIFDGITTLQQVELIQSSQESDVTIESKSDCREGGR